MRLFILKKDGEKVTENYMDAEKDYMLGIKYKNIATKYGAIINTVKDWEQRYEWSRG